MVNILYILKINKLEEFLVSKGLKHSYDETPKDTARRFCQSICNDYNADYDVDSIVVYVEDGYVSYSDLEYLDDNGIEFEGYKWFDLRFQKKNNSIWY